MKKSVLVLLVMIAVGWLDGSKIEVKCPEFCDCDVFKGLKRAVCENRRLVSIELNIPAQAEILDLSYNQISELGDKIFLDIGLTNLKLLNLSHNKIHHIHFNGFKGLDNLKTLDLSFNAVEYFTKSWFESLSSLEELYLRGNKLRTINQEPQISLHTLKILDLSKCGITSLNGKSLAMVPNLEILDISENFMQVIQVELLKTLPKLTTFKTDDNNLNCRDLNVVEVGNYARKHKIAYTDSCKIDFPTSFTVNHRMHKFEKIVMADDMNQSTTTTLKPKNSWIVEDNSSKIAEACNNATSDKEISLLMDIIQLSPWMTICITFAYGVLFGMVLTCALNVCINKKKPTIPKDIELADGSVNCNIRGAQSVPNLPNRPNKKHVRRSNSVLYMSINKARRQLSREVMEDDDNNEVLVMNEFDLASSTPVANRRPLT